MTTRPVLRFALCLTALAVAACGPARRSNSGGGGGGGGGAGGGGGGVAGGADGEAARTDAGQYQEQRSEKLITAANADLQSLYTDGNRAGMLVDEGTLAGDETIVITSRALNEFTDTDDIIDGVYDFQPHGVGLNKPVTIFLPLNNAAVTSVEQVELVRWSAERGWEAVDATLKLENGPPRVVEATVDSLGVFGLRIVGGWAALDDDEVGGEGGGGPDEFDCPGSKDDFEIGGGIGQRFPDPNLRNGDGEGESLYNLCGNKAILIASVAFW